MDLSEAVCFTVRETNAQESIIHVLRKNFRMKRFVGPKITDGNLQLRLIEVVPSSIGF